VANRDPRNHMLASPANVERAGWGVISVERYPGRKKMPRRSGLPNDLHLGGVRTAIVHHPLSRSRRLVEMVSVLTLRAGCSCLRSTSPSDDATCEVLLEFAMRRTEPPPARPLRGILADPLCRLKWPSSPPLRWPRIPPPSLSNLDLTWTLAWRKP